MAANSVLRANLRSSGKRLWAAAAAITVSVAFIVTGMMLVASLSQSVTDEAEQQVAGADLIIPTTVLQTQQDDDAAEAGDVGAGDIEAADAVVAEAIEQVDSTQTAEVVRRGQLDVWDSPTEFVAGFGVRTLTEGQEHELTKGRLPAAEDELLINASAAEAEQLSVGDTLAASEVDWGDPGQQSEQREAPELGGQKQYQVVGISADEGPPTGAVTAAGMDRLPDAAQPEEIRVVLPEGAHGDPDAQQAVQAQIAEVVAELVAAGELSALGSGEQAAPQQTGPLGIVSVSGLQIATHQQFVDQQVQNATGDARILQYIAFGFGGIAVFVSALVITNTFQVIVASRMRTMALIRAVGGTAAQLRRATLAEGALLGVIGGAVGVVLGWGLHQLVVLLTRIFTDGEGMQPTLPSPLAVGIGLGLGTLMAAGSALIPALKAGRVSPMAALRPADVASPERTVSTWRTVLGSLVTVAGLALVLYAALVRPAEAAQAGAANMDPVSGLPLPVLGVLGGVLSFLGVLVVAKAIIPPLVAVLGRALAALGVASVPAKLAGQNARQVPGRTAATSAALLVGVTLVVMMTTGAATAQKMLFDELAESHPVDGVVVSDDEQVVDEVQQRPEVAASSTAEATTATAGETEVRVIAAEQEFFDEVAHTPGVGPQPGQALIGWGVEPETSPVGDAELLTLQHDALQHDEAALELETSTVSWLPADVVIISAADLPAQWEADSQQSASMVRFAQGVSESELRALEAEYQDEAGAVTFSGGLARASYVRVIDMALLAVLALLGASVFVAVIGVSNTLSLSVFERRREAALLRAVGMNRRSVGAMISIEALLLAGTALLLGTGLGLLFGWAGVSSLIAREDWAVVLEVPWLRLALIWGVTGLAAVVAAWLPARSLAKVEPARGLSHAA